MAKLVFRLNHVPDIEADGVRDCLTEANIPFYETQEGRWGLSVAAIWLVNDDDFEKARALIDDYQVVYRKQYQIDLQAAKEAGQIPTFWQLFRSQPFTVISYIGLAAIVLGFTLIPMFYFF